eukprot:7389957-Prymnesium_polylepis.1
MTYSTADNSRPLEVAPLRVREVRLGVLLPMFGAQTAGYNAVRWSPRVEVYQALREINNKSDGIDDSMLPNTQLHFAYRDSKCEASSALTEALHLTRDAFKGEGVDLMIGAGCSEASETAAQVSKSSSVPMVSPASIAPPLSDGVAYPYFLRTIPSDAVTAAAMVDVLRTLWNYTNVALVHSTDPYGTFGANAFVDAALGDASTRSLEIGITERIERNSKESVDVHTFYPHIDRLRVSGAR